MRGYFAAFWTTLECFTKLKSDKIYMRMYLYIIQEKLISKISIEGPIDILDCVGGGFWISNVSLFTKCINKCCTQTSVYVLSVGNHY